MRTIALLFLLTCPLAVICEEDDHAGHEHGGANAWEWAGTFQFEKGVTYRWMAQKKGGKYADPAMQLAIIDAKTNNKAGLESTEDAATTLFAGKATDVEKNAALNPNQLYNLKFDQTESETVYTITVTTTSAYAIFAQHMPTEFEDTLHYLKDSDGADIEPGAQEQEGDSHDGHDHGGNGLWEWAGTFTLEKGTTYTWMAQKKDGNYADATMKIAIMDSGTNDKDGLEKTEKAAEKLFEGSDTDVQSNSALEVGKLYNLQFDQQAYQSTYTITVPKTSGYAFFAQHFPIEFEDTLHYLKDSAGTDIEPGVEEPEKVAPGNKNSLGEAAAASIVTAMMAFIGVLTLAPMLKKCMQPSYAFAVASGVLLACALMLMWPESLHLIPVDMDSPKESEVSAVFAVMVLLGFVTAPCLTWFVAQITGRDPDHHHGTGTEIKMKDVEGQLGGYGGDTPSQKPKNVDWGLVLSIAFGDGFHNICDGVVIGVAFKLCNATTAWTVAAGAIWHEAAQELSDFLVLTSAAGMSTGGALCINFISALSCIVATLVIWEIEMTNTAVGCFLAYGGGTYVYLGTVATFAKLPKTQIALHAFLFILGAVSIGLVLLKHEHCVGDDGGGDAHAGHGH